MTSIFAPGKSGTATKFSILHRHLCRIGDENLTIHTRSAPGKRRRRFSGKSADGCLSRPAAGVVLCLENIEVGILVCSATVSGGASPLSDESGSGSPLSFHPVFWRRFYHRGEGVRSLLRIFVSTTPGGLSPCGSRIFVYKHTPPTLRIASGQGICTCPLLGRGSAGGSLLI